jgi:NAD+ synthase
MEFKGEASELSGRQKEVFEIFTKFNRTNNHKMVPIPVCTIPLELK